MRELGCHSSHAQYGLIQQSAERHMDEFLKYFIAKWPEILNGLEYTMLIYGIGLAIESFLPAEKNQKTACIRFNMLYTVCFIVANSLLFGAIIHILKPTVDFLGGPYFHINFDRSVSGQLLHVFCYLFVFDFFYYWFHRWQHKSKVLWGQHQFHHSEKSLNITTGSRHHWLEDSIRIFIVLIPMSALVEFKAEYTGVIWSTFMLWGFFIHMNLKLSLGVFSRLIAGPQLHRIHHSKLAQHQDKNFAAFFPVYDILFGTYWKVGKHEYPATGLSNGKDMNNLIDANFYPFKYWFGNLINLFSIPLKK